MATTVNEMLKTARSWIGYSEKNGKFKEILNVYNSHKPLARGYTVKVTDEWCATFVSACAIKVGAVDLIGTECSCNKFIDIFKRKGIWIEDGAIRPEPGDIVLYNWDDRTQPNDGAADHIGIVEQVVGITITVIEGNKNEKVDRRSFNIGWGYIRGFARPKYLKDSSTSSGSPKKTIDQIANEVIRGVWGSGAIRKASLTKAGYDYNTVQARVNQILSGGAKKSINVIAKEVIAGKWGVGVARKNALTRAGYDYKAVQKKVNELL